ncbi:MAG: L-threonine 3-dehydrogenase [Firmicutes bacterium]|nr:L-threonine 3-dehydrogenase [Bacillota bacterium]
MGAVVPETMLAIRKKAAAPGAELSQVPTPAPGPGEVLIRIKVAAICGTDVHIYRWDPWAQQHIRPPMTFGHEFCGEVVAVGPMVKGVAVGDFVTAEGHITCGVCHACRTGDGHICENVQIIGVDRDGAFAEYLVMPARNIWHLDPRMPLEVAAIHDPLGNAVHTAFATELTSKTVNVIGCGPIGLAAVAIARWAGAARVFAVEPMPYRQELARRMGAHVVIDPGREDPVARILGETEGLGTDVMLEMSGQPQAIRQGFAALRKGGFAALLGIPAAPMELDLAEAVIFKGARVQGISGRRMWDTWYRLQGLIRGGLDFRPLVTHRFTFQQLDQAFELMASGNSGKILLFPKEVQ